MPTLLDKVPATLGRLIRVKNMNPTNTKAKKIYIAVYVEGADGNNERCLLLTPQELKRAEKRAQTNPEDVPLRDPETDLRD
jgi:hypothetical protein